VDFSLTHAQQELSALTRQILADQVTADRLAQLDKAGQGFDQALWADLATAGVLAAALPERAGGDGYGLAEQCSVLAEIGRAVAPAPYLESVVLGAAAIAEFGDEAQVRRWAVPAAAGELVITAALAEPGDDNPPALATRAALVTGGWTLTGTKTAVWSGADAGLFLVPASTADGIVVFCVERADPGTTVAPQRLIEAAGAAQLELDDVRLGAERVLGTAGLAGGAGGTAAVAEWLTARATVGLCALQLGVTERALELTAAYTRTREQFGRPIGAFQAVAQRLADGYIDVEAIRLTMWQAAWRLEAGLPCDEEIATAKFWAADGGHRVAHTAVHVHGGVGIDISHLAHRYFTAAKRHEFALGGATAQLRRLGAALAGAGG
jgi:3-oxocholest-4-en-26-oyl-CoA dehydrogenase beta subunit